MIDAGNANFHDTNRRSAAGLPFRFLGLGVSGGEEGARHGPADHGRRRGRGLGAHRARSWTAIAARAEDGTPCAARMGEAGAGHFVKTVHNGIEYADMQMIAEVYGLMRDGMDMSAATISRGLRALEPRRAAILPDRDLGSGRGRDGSRHRQAHARM